MRIAITGAQGALGLAVAEAARRREHDVVEWGHADCDITDLAAVTRAVAAARPQTVINCAGAIPERTFGAATYARVNAAGPHLLNAACQANGARLVHISTDCVFRGDVPPEQLDKPHYWYEPPTATDLYGLSKAFGETGLDGATAVRTSYVTPRHGLWQWMMRQQRGGQVPGWHRALWSGSTVWAVAAGIVHIVESPFSRPVEHLATAEPITKADVLTGLRNVLGLPVLVEYVDLPIVHRWLAPTVVLPPLAEGLEAWAVRTIGG